MSWVKQKNEYARDAFTIVELLIVIVIIAILAAITIISYVGIQNRAKASAAQTLLSQTVSKVRLYAVDHSDTYPSSLSAAGITSTDGLQYSSSSSSPSTFCITATSQNVSYYQSSTTTAPTAGACPGHGVNGGGVVVNLVVNPNGANIVYMDFNGGAGSLVVLNSGGQSGAEFIRGTASKDGSTLGPFKRFIDVVSSKVYMASAYVRTSASTAMKGCVEWKDSNGVGAGASACGSYVSTSSNTWGRVSVTGTAPAGATSATFTVYGTINNGDWVDIDSMMFTEGTTLHNYTDPTTNSSWAWTGAPNNSTSTGPSP